MLLRILHSERESPKIITLSVIVRIIIVYIRSRFPNAERNGRVSLCSPNKDLIAVNKIF